MSYHMQTTKQAREARARHLQEEAQYMKEAQRLYKQEKLFKVLLLVAIIVGTIVGSIIGTM